MEVHLSGLEAKCGRGASCGRLAERRISSPNRRRTVDDHNGGGARSAVSDPAVGEVEIMLPHGAIKGRLPMRRDGVLVRAHTAVKALREPWATERLRQWARCTAASGVLMRKARLSSM